MNDETQSLDFVRERIDFYVRWRLKDLPPNDAADLASAAFCDARRRIAKFCSGQFDNSFLADIAHNCLVNALRDAKNRRNVFRRAFLPLETPTEEDEREKAEYSDHGAGVERLTRQIDAEDEHLPDWVYGVRIERAKLCGTERRIANALASGKSTHTIQRELHLDWPTFRGKMQKLQRRFAPYYKGLCAWRASHSVSPL